MRLVRRTGLAILLVCAGLAHAQSFDYPYDPAVVEVMFIQESAVRLDGVMLVDLSGLDAVAGVDAVVVGAGGGEWRRVCEGVPRTRRSTCGPPRPASPGANRSTT